MIPDLKYKIALTLIPGVGNVIARNLVSYCGSVEGVDSTMYIVAGQIGVAGKQAVRIGR